MTAIAETETSEDVAVETPEAPDMIHRIVYRRGQTLHALFADSVEALTGKDVLVRHAGGVKLLKDRAIVRHDKYVLDELDVDDASDSTF